MMVEGGEKVSVIADRGKEGAAFGKQQISCAKTNVSDFYFAMVTVNTSKHHVHCIAETGP